MFLVPFQKKGLENRSSRFEPKNSWLSFWRGSGPPLRNYCIASVFFWCFGQRINNQDPKSDLDFFDLTNFWECTGDFWLDLVLVRRTSLVQRTRTRSSGKLRLETVIGSNSEVGMSNFRFLFKQPLKRDLWRIFRFWFSSPRTFRASVWIELGHDGTNRKPITEVGNFESNEFYKCERLFYKRSKQILVPILFPQVPNCVPLRFLTTKFPETRNSWSVGFECFLKIQMESMMESENAVHRG